MQVNRQRSYSFSNWDSQNSQGSQRIYYNYNDSHERHSRWDSRDMPSFGEPFRSSGFSFKPGNHRRTNTENSRFEDSRLTAQ